ncbi:helix-turn-helix domain-containing protein [Kitasatospora sp. NPDC051170]|uniref:helix-turn-helix domain-containing protein n=1 Tax=Kitasatospora sp. NPDC051170 TaxID=3364056 RepID=UPI0037B60F5B
MPEGIGESTGADAVAGLLQELKSRSGLSYGALAKRLHVSTSALHRYCNGDATPVEFASLERFARVCRATPEEHAELYRLWVAADAARGNRQAAAPAAPEPHVEAEPEPEPEPEAEAVAGPEARPAARTSAAPKRRRVRRGVLAAVAAAAVLAAVGAVAIDRGTGSGGGPGQSAGSAAPPSTPGATPTATDRGESAPITVAVRPSGWDSECDRFLVDRPPSQVPRPPEVLDVPGWASKLGAVPGQYQSIKLTVQGTGSETVVLTALNVRIARIAAPLPWNAYAVGEGCGGGVGLQSYDLDLDAARPRPVVSGGRSGLPLKVSERDPEVIEVNAETRSHDVSWYLELEWSSGNRKGTLSVGLGDGEPFRTSALKGRPQYHYPIGANAWELSPFQQ